MRLESEAAKREAASRPRRMGLDRRNSKWDEGFRRLSAYLKHHGSPPPLDHEQDGYRLGAWVAQQRPLSRTGKLEKDRWAKLDELTGWEWKPPRGAAARRV